ncbi:MAG: AmmeMemoRadiSam system radical SAM enzyme [Candidatus Micrarchaeota archaeon]
MHEAKLYKRLPGGKVRCTACAHYCEVSPGHSGACGVRKNLRGKLYLLAYGSPVSVCVDPVEKKPLFHFLPGRRIFSLGTLGCNFGCDFCQNWDISQAVKLARVKRGTGFREEDLFTETWPPEKIVNYCQANGIPAVAFTYNEPGILHEWALDTFQLAHKKKIRTVYVSNGFSSKEAVKAIAPHLDAVNVDLKSFDDGIYRRVCKSRLQPVLDTIRQYHKLGAWVEVTTLVIPGMNDSSAELRQIAEFIAGVGRDVPWHVTAFRPEYRMADKPPTPLSSLLRARRIGIDAGLRFVYAGNVEHAESESTFCPKCGKILIRRSGFSVDTLDFNGKCPSCKAPIPGVWK